MKIIADENIPLVEHYFGSSGDLVLKPGRDITHQDLIDADILLVRSVTEVNEKLLHHTKIKFVASATTGMDHMDTDWLDKNGIHWAIAKGSNATAVFEYVVATIAVLQKQHYLTQSKLRAGVIGVGLIGAQVVHKLQQLNFEVLQYDPLRAENEKDFVSTPLDQFKDLDFITLHTPLVKEGKHPTYHLIDEAFLKRQKSGCVLLNTGRGAVIDFNALKEHGQHLLWCLDVWEDEPGIDLEILKNAYIATPHIAGYSVQAKYRGVEMIYQAAIQQKIIPDDKIISVEFPTKTISFDHASVTWRDVVLKIYDPMQTTQEMKEALLQHKNTFDFLRKNFTERYEFAYVTLQNATLVD